MGQTTQEKVFTHFSRSIYVFTFLLLLLFYFKYWKSARTNWDASCQYKHTHSHNYFIFSISSTFHYYFYLFTHHRGFYDSEKCDNVNDADVYPQNIECKYFTILLNFSIHYYSTNFMFEILYGSPFYSRDILDLTRLRAWWRHTTTQPIHF